MQRRTVNSGGSDPSSTNCSTVAETASITPARSKKDDTPQHSVSSPPINSIDEEVELRSSTRFILLRSFLLVTIFLILFTLTQRYFLEPTFQPHRTAEYQRQLELQRNAQIAAKACPEGSQHKQDHAGRDGSIASDASE